MGAGCCRWKYHWKGTARRGPQPRLPLANRRVIGAIEKMSKSRKNLVDPDDIIAGYGADCARWFMLSDSPPERDVIWTEAGVAGASRFIQRIWRMVDEIIAEGAAKGTERPATFGDDALALRRAVHKTLHQVGQNIEGLRFNVSVAQLYEAGRMLFKVHWRLAQRAVCRYGSGRFGKPGEIVVQMIGPMMPHLAEECWERLDDNSILAEQPWPEAEAALLVDDTGDHCRTGEWQATG